MKIKTYPFQFTEEYLQVIADYAKENNISIKEFCLEAIDEAVNEKILKKKEK